MNTLRVLHLGFAAGLLVYWAGLLAGVDAQWLTHRLFLGVMIVATVSLITRATSQREDRYAWALLASGVMLWTGGWIVYLGADAHGQSLPSPGVVDVLWLSLYPFAIAALIHLCRQSRGIESVMAVDILTITLITAGIVTTAVVPHLLASDNIAGLERFVVVSYQVGDCILASIAIVALAVAGRQASATLILLAAAILTLGIGDAAWSFQVAAGPLPSLMHSNAIFPLTMALLVAAAWQPPRERRPSSAGAEMRIHAAVVLAVVLGIALLAANEWIAVPAVSVVLVAMGLTAAMHRIWRALLKILRATRVAARERERVDEVRNALAAGELVLHYQPLVELRNGAVHGVEALLRWDARRPDEFLPAVERSDLMRAITDLVLERALGDLAAWRAAGHDIGMSVNLASTNLGEIDLPERVANALLRHQVPARRLTLELTETAALCSGVIPDRVVTALDAVGVALSIDDFGTGHSSMARIARFPIAEIKIDRSFVSDMKHAKLPIVETSISLAQGLGLRVVAEGVEDADMVEQLRTFGCDLGQGYFFARPMEAAAVRRWLDARSHAGTNAVMDG